MGLYCTESLCPAIFEIMDDKHIRVTTLTFTYIHTDIYEIYNAFIDWAWFYVCANTI